ncbi:VWA domain-containing protein [Deinococcus taeanensis]|uniref:VWA domain-containing protein n=1 Tax=Deinococcus taeanensis TaxID=2737050 RepID=UPI001CDCA19F|nr:VWA domain-containing protein [Deinococcus taeanensis]UBV42841.1 VWA domain-containing protein [Deinococcus taeanensis]
MAELGPAAPAALSAQVTAFAARLRDRHVFLIGPGEVQTALEALGMVDVLSRREVRAALRSVLAASPEQVRVFDLEFNAFFRTDGHSAPRLPPLLPETPAPAAPGPGGEAGEPGEAAGPPEPGAPAPQATPGEQPGEPGGPPQGQETGDPDSNDHDADAPVIRTQLSPNAAPGAAVHAGEGDLAQLLRAASDLIRALELGRARRLRPMPRGSKLDARRTLHAAARTAGDAVTLRWLGRPRRAPRFLLVLDGSRSMGRDATLLLRFAQALHLRSRRVEVFAFSTGLLRLTPLLRRAAPGQPLDLPDLGVAWGGGTRIGENLLRLARDERGRVDRHTVILILSDGLDTGDPALVARALRDLRRRAAGVVWLSPLAATPGYRPVQRAIAAALPFLDALLPAGGADDLHRLGRRLRAARRAGPTGRGG